MKIGDECPICKTGILEYMEPDDPNDIHPNGGRYGECFWCDYCGNILENKKAREEGE